MLESRRTESTRLARLTRYSGLVLTVAVALSAAACGTEPTSQDIPGAERIAIPAEFQAWWSATQQCSGLSGQFDDLEFYQVPGVSTFTSGVGTVVGLWDRDNGHNRITLAGNYLDNELVVRHEMLHALLERDGHPAEYFVNRCALTWESWPNRNGQTNGAPPIGDLD